MGLVLWIASTAGNGPPLVVWHIGSYSLLHRVYPWCVGTSVHAVSCSGTFEVAGGAYSGSWSVEGDDIIFTAAAQTTGWVGIGFSLDRVMVSAHKL